MAMDASMASFRPWREERGTSRREAGDSSERSLARFLIPMENGFCVSCGENGYGRCRDVNKNNVQ